MDEARYNHVLVAIGTALAGGHGLAAVVDTLHDRLPHYSWVGFYSLQGDELVLGPWCGPAESARGRTGAGDGGHLACIASTRSEIVVPVRRGGRVVGELDIESDRPAAFGPADRRLLERVAALIAVRLPDPLPSLSWLVDEWGLSSFPASDPPCRWAGGDAVRGAPARVPAVVGDEPEE